MKATQAKSLVEKVMTAGVLAGALMFVAPAKAEAQQFSVGVQIGRPAAYPDYYARRDYYDRLRWEQARRAEIARREWIRRQEWLRREQREHRYDAYDYRYSR